MPFFPVFQNFGHAGENHKAFFAYIRIDLMVGFISTIKLKRGK
jgi:hypothetical protein